MEAESWLLKDESLSLYNRPKTDKYGVVKNWNKNNWHLAQQHSQRVWIFLLLLI